jgi:hypothetical protein
MSEENVIVVGTCNRNKIIGDKMVEKHNKVDIKRGGRLDAIGFHEPIKILNNNMIYFLIDE